MDSRVLGHLYIKETPIQNERGVILIGHLLSTKTAATYSPTNAVPSARSGLTSLFGMGRGGTPTDRKSVV